MAIDDNNKTHIEGNPKNKLVRFCSYCGTQLDVGANFCKNCGESIANNTRHTTSVHNDNEQNAVGREPVTENPTERQTVFEGKVHKCPNCGEVIKSFSVNCPSCGYEFRGSSASTSVQKLAYKLEQIESKEMPKFEEKKSVMKIVFGKDFKNEDELEEAQDRFNEQKAQQKANLIANYSVPNTKEDILEFMILASSNINTKKSLDDEVTKAWLSKLEQVYQKAAISLSDTSDFTKIKNIYDKKKDEIKNKKLKTASFIVLGILVYFSLIGLLWNPVATISILIGIIILFGIGYILFGKR